MSVILCPTRGGQSSVPNQMKAISIAKERDATLIFLYVSSVNFLHNISAPILIDIAHELDEMGEFLLAMASERAENEDVIAKSVVRNGSYKDNLLQVVDEYNVDTVVMGSASGATGLTTEDYVQLLAEDLAENNVEFLIVQDGKVL